MKYIYPRPKASSVVLPLLKGLLLHLHGTHRGDIGKMERSGNEVDNTHACHILGFNVFQAIMEWYCDNKSQLADKLNEYDADNGLLSKLIPFLLRYKCVCDHESGASDECPLHNIAVRLLQRLNRGVNLQIKHVIVNKSAHTRIENAFIRALFSTDARNTICLQIGNRRTGVHTTKISKAAAYTYFVHMSHMCEVLFPKYDKQADLYIGGLHLAELVGFLVAKVLERVERVDEAHNSHPPFNFLMFELRYISRSLANGWAPRLSGPTNTERVARAWEKVGVAKKKFMKRMSKRGGKVTNEERQIAAGRLNRLLAIARGLTEKSKLVRVLKVEKSGKRRFSLIPQAALEAHARLFTDVFASGEINICRIKWSSGCGVQNAVRELVDGSVEIASVMSFLRHFNKHTVQPDRDTTILSSIFLRDVICHFFAGFHEGNPSILLPRPHLIIDMLKNDKTNSVALKEINRMLPKCKCPRTKFDGQEQQECPMANVVQDAFNLIERYASKRDAPLPKGLRNIRKRIQEIVLELISNVPTSVKVSSEYLNEYLFLMNKVATVASLKIGESRAVSSEAAQFIVFLFKFALRQTQKNFLE